MRTKIHAKNATTITALLTALLAIVGIALPLQAAQAAVPNAITSISTTSTVDGQWSRMDFTCQWAVPDGSRPGDTFTLQLPAQLGWFGPADFPLKNPSGDTVATARASDSGLVVFTLGNFVATHPKNIGGTCSFSTLYLEKPPSGGTTILEFTIGSSVIRVPAIVDQPCQQDCAPKPPTSPVKNMWWADSAQTRLKSLIALPPTTLPSSDITITDMPGPGTAIDCSQITPLGGKSLDQDGNIATPTDTAAYPAAVTCTPSLLTVTWTGLPKGELVQLFVITTITDTTLALYTNSGKVSISGQDTPIMAETRRTSASGTGNGTSLPSSPTPPHSPTPTTTASVAPAPEESAGPSPSATDTIPAEVPTPSSSVVEPASETLANTGATGTATVPVAVLFVTVGTMFAWLGIRTSAKRRAH